MQKYFPVSREIYPWPLPSWPANQHFGRLDICVLSFDVYRPKRYKVIDNRINLVCMTLQVDEHSPHSPKLTFYPWSHNLKINGGHLLSMAYQCTKFYVSQAKFDWKICRTTYCNMWITIWLLFAIFKFNLI